MKNYNFQSRTKLATNNIADNTFSSDQQLLTVQLADWHWSYLLVPHLLVLPISS